MRLSIKCAASTQKAASTAQTLCKAVLVLYVAGVQIALRPGNGSSVVQFNEESRSMQGLFRCPELPQALSPPSPSITYLHLFSLTAPHPDFTESYFHHLVTTHHCLLGAVNIPNPSILCILLYSLCSYWGLPWDKNITSSFFPQLATFEPVVDPAAQPGNEDNMVWFLRCKLSSISRTAFKPFILIRERL